MVGDRTEKRRLEADRYEREERRNVCGIRKTVQGKGESGVLGGFVF